MADERLELLRGTLDLLILKVLAGGTAHGYTIARRIRERSAGVLLVEEGSLYPALHRLERRGWLTAEWGSSEGNRRAKFYSLSRAGRRELAARERDWSEMAGAIRRVLDPAPEGGA
jgi:transcriptional regulator